jgi:hypothetical protein
VNCYLPYFRQQLICPLLLAIYFCRLCLLKVREEFSPLPFLPSPVSSKHPILSATCPSQFLVYYSVFFFFVGQGFFVCVLVYPGVPVLKLHADYFFTYWSVSPKQVWNRCLVVREPSCFLSVTWHGEALYGLGVQGAGVLLILVFFFFYAKGGSNILRFLIYRAHAVCFLPLVTILDPLSLRIITSGFVVLLYIFLMISNI